MVTLVRQQRLDRALTLFARARGRTREFGHARLSELVQLLEDLFFRTDKARVSRRARAFSL